MLYTCSDGFVCASKELMKQREERLRLGLTETQLKIMMKRKREEELLRKKVESWK
jgi:hypothetical protein